MSDPIHSTGRGGAGNIGPDGTEYVAGDITREGFQGEPNRTGQLDYSAGRGGAGNMVSTPRSGTPQPPGVQSADIVPETAMRAGAGQEDFHTGRGGGGNVHKDKYGGHSGPQGESLLDKAKNALHMGKGDKKDSTT